ncbi:MAG: DUF6263 family protein [Planctomycetota bacterium]
MSCRLASVRWVLTVLVLLSGVGVALAEDQIDLSMNLEPGDSFTMELLMEQDIDQNMMGRPIGIDQTIGLTMRFDVLDKPADSGGDWMSCTYTRVRFKQNGPMGNADFDSENPPANVPMTAWGFAGLTGQVIEMEFAPGGEVVQIEGVDAMIANMLDTIDLPEGPQRNAARDLIRTQVSEDMLKQMMGMFAALSPPGPVAIGDTWNDTQVIGGMMPMSISNDLKLVGFDGDTATLDVTGTISPDPDAEPFDINNMQVEAELTGTQAGQVVMDRRTGWAKSSKTTQKMEGGMIMLMENGGELEVDMTIDSTVTMTMIN